MEQNNPTAEPQFRHVDWFEPINGTLEDIYNRLLHYDVPFNRPLKRGGDYNLGGFVNEALIYLGKSLVNEPADWPNARWEKLLNAALRLRNYDVGRGTRKGINFEPEAWAALEVIGATLVAAFGSYYKFARLHYRGGYSGGIICFVALVAYEEYISETYKTKRK